MEEKMEMMAEETTKKHLFVNTYLLLIHPFETRGTGARKLSQIRFTMLIRSLNLLKQTKTNQSMIKLSQKKTEEANK